MTLLEKQGWFNRAAVPVGRTLAALLVLFIVFYAQTGFLRSQDWRYYMTVGLSLPFMFTAFKNSAFDLAIAVWSYPIYLAHGVILGIWAPFRHFVPISSSIYFILLLTLPLCFVVLRADERIQRRFKRVV